MAVDHWITVRRWMVGIGSNPSFFSLEDGLGPLGWWLASQSLFSPAGTSFFLVLYYFDQYFTYSGFPLFQK
jgi:hypothetical protein